MIQNQAKRTYASNWCQPFLDYLSTGRGNLEEILDEMAENLKEIIYERIKKFTGGKNERGYMV